MNRMSIEFPQHIQKPIPRATEVMAASQLHILIFGDEFSVKRFSSDLRQLAAANENQAGIAIVAEILRSCFWRNLREDLLKQGQLPLQQIKSFNPTAGLNRTFAFEGKFVHWWHRFASAERLGLNGITNKV